jgi:hypothetical protein
MLFVKRKVLSLEDARAYIHNVSATGKLVCFLLVVSCASHRILILPPFLFDSELKTKHAPIYDPALARTLAEYTSAVSSSDLLDAPHPRWIMLLVNTSVSSVHSLWT